MGGRKALYVVMVEMRLWGGVGDAGIMGENYKP